tara:strand:+ start:2326 stop:2760 length:435 start_codon:yes stop_codon:yes gene_type:complete
MVEEGKLLAPKFNNDGLIPVVVTEYKTGNVLMLSYMNKEALEKTILTGEGYYWSRSRGLLWKKGETSGMVHEIKELLIDDDQDSVWLKVKVKGLGASCHVGYKSCFYRKLEKTTDESIQLKFIENAKTFDPEIVYTDSQNPTKL